MCQAPSHIAAGLLLLMAEVCASRPALLHRMLSEATPISPTASEESDAYSQLDTYDALKREPEYACPTAPSLWELSLMGRHFHPSVAAFTQSLLHPPHKILFDGTVHTHL